MRPWPVSFQKLSSGRPGLPATLASPTSEPTLGCPLRVGMGVSLVQRRRAANRRDSHTSPTLRSTNEMRGYDVPTMGAREGTDDFRGQLRRHREAAGLSQEELAERSALTAKAISALETGERQHPYPQTVRALADALRLSDLDRSALIAAVPTRARTERADPAMAAAQPLDLPPSEPTPLLGRIDELRIIREQLLTPEVRLLRRAKASTRWDSSTSPRPATQHLLSRRLRACRGPRGRARAIR